MIYHNDVNSWDDWRILRAKGYTEVDGNFNCSFSNLYSLVGSPTKTKKFNCTGNYLKNLIGSPDEVTELFCMGNHLDSLLGSPTFVKDFYCYNNNLRSLKHSPEQCDHFDCSDNNIESMKHTPVISHTLDCSFNKLVTMQCLREMVHLHTLRCVRNRLIDFKYFPQTIDYLDVSQNNIKTLKGAPYVKLNLNATGNPLLRGDDSFGFISTTCQVKINP